MTPAPIRLLVVEDDALQSELVERALGRDGFEVRTVTSVRELRAAVADFAPEIVLVDVNLPDAPDGAMVPLVRELAPSARVVLYSAWEEAKLKKLARDLGADSYISKSEPVFEIGRRLREPTHR
jgi:two-component system, OmpR family, response regulator